MQVFVTGATGTLGRHPLPGLVAAGHEGTAAARTPGQVAQWRGAGPAGDPARYHRVPQPGYDSPGR